MIEPTDEMCEAFQVAAGWPGPPWRFGADVANGLAAVLAIVERDRCMEAAGHVWHPLAAGRAPKGWLIEHVDHHPGAPVEGCTFCPRAPGSADEHHYDVPCRDRPHCRIHEQYEGDVLP